MKKEFSLRIFLVGLVAFSGLYGFGQYAPKNPQVTPDLQQVNNQFATQGLRFTENKGQVADLNGRLRPDILFTAQNEGVKLFLTANGIHYQFRREFAKPVQENKMVGKHELEEVDSTQFYRLDLTLKGANPNPKVIKEGAGVDLENFFLAHCPDGITGVRNYNRITYKEVYPNIDWVVYVKDGKLEYDFVVRPGGDIDDIKLQYNGGENLDLDKTGALHIKTPLGKVTEQKPFSFQQEGREVASRFVLEGNTLGFAVPEFDENKELTIDPSIVWATYYGGDDTDEGFSCEVDGSGNVYLAGRTFSTNGIASGGHQTTYEGNPSPFLVKFNSAGIRQWATYYCGNGQNYGHSVACDLSGNVYLAGTTEATTGVGYNGYQSTHGGGNEDAFLVKFNEFGVRQWGTYYGGSGPDQGFGVKTDAFGNVYLTGITQSTSGISYNGHQNGYGGGYEDAFLVKFNSLGLRQWGTYYGGTSNDVGTSVSVDLSGNVYMKGITSSSTGIAFGGHQNVFGGGSQNSFLVKFNEFGVRQWGTYYEVPGNVQGNSVATDPAANVYMVSDNKLVKFNGSGIMQWEVSYPAVIVSLAINGSGDVFISGSTYSPDGIAFGGIQNWYNGDPYDGFLAKFNSDGLRQWGTYLGGENEDDARSVATDKSGNVIVAGYTNSTSQIAQNGHQNNFGGYEYDAFLIKISDSPPLPDADNDGEPDASDCAPNDATKYKTGYLYKDADNDGFDGGQANVCYGATVPTGYNLTTLGTDCDDAKNTIFRSAIFYLDADMDGYDAGQQNVCYGLTLPASYKLTTLGTDCDDANAKIYPGATELCDKVDNDCDGVVDLPGCTYNDSDEDGSPDYLDCAPNDPAKWRTGIFYLDFDRDGYHGSKKEFCYGYELDDVFKNYYSTTTRGIDCDDNCRTATTSVIMYVDWDGDGYHSEIVDECRLIYCLEGEDPPMIYKYSHYTTLGDDCDDHDKTIKGNNIIWYKDKDNDGYSDGSILIKCNQPAGYKLEGSLTSILGDCDDSKAAIRPGAPDICDGIDNDCDGRVDEDISTWYKDSDNDGYSDGFTLTQCAQPVGYKLASGLAATSGDCNDDNAAIKPGAKELCDGIDNDCDTQTDEGCPVGTAWYFDYDKDGYGNAAKMVYAVTQPFKYVANSADCRDWDPLSYPGADETGDGIDNNCNGLTDEGLDCLKTWYYDGDGDGYGSDAHTRLSCKQHNNYVLLGGDCKNWDANVYPGHGCPPVTGIIVGTEGTSILPKAMWETSAVIQVFPNPARDEVMVTLNGFEVGKKVELQMIQADGKVVSAQSLTPFVRSQQVRVDVRKLSAGYYLLQVKQGALQQTKKVMIVK